MSDRILTLFGEEMFPDQSKPGGNGGKGRGKKKSAEPKEEQAAEAQPEQPTEEQTSEVPAIAFNEPTTTANVPVIETVAEPEVLSVSETTTTNADGGTDIAEAVSNKEGAHFEEEHTAEQAGVDIVYADDTFYSDIRPEDDQQTPEVFWKQFFISEEVTDTVEDKQPDTLHQQEAAGNESEENKVEDTGIHTTEELAQPKVVPQISDTTEPISNVPEQHTEEPEQNIAQPEIVVEIVEPPLEQIIETSIFLQELPNTHIAEKEEAEPLPAAEVTIEETIPEPEEEEASFIIHNTTEESNVSRPEVATEEEQEITESVITDHQEQEYSEYENEGDDEYEELYRDDQDELTESAMHISDDELEKEITGIEQELSDVGGDEAFSGAEEEIRYIANEDIPRDEQVVIVEESFEQTEKTPAESEDIAEAMQSAIAAIEEIIVSAAAESIELVAMPVADKPEEVGAGIDNAIVAIEEIILAADMQAEVVDEEQEPEVPSEKEEAVVAEITATRKAKKTKTEEPEQANLPADWKGEKNYYSIGEVADLFNVKTSHIRFWTNEFKLKVRTTRKGDRLYTPDQVREIRTIYHLVKERGFTLAGAKARLKSQSKKDVETIDLKDSLIQLRNKLVAIKNQLGAGKKK